MNKNYKNRIKINKDEIFDNEENEKCCDFPNITSMFKQKLLNLNIFLNFNYIGEQIKTFLSNTSHKNV